MFAFRWVVGAGAAAEQAADGLVETERVAKLRPYESHLKKFNYHLALDAALKTRNPLVVVTVLGKSINPSILPPPSHVHTLI
jgi:UTP15 C terminal